MSRSQRRLLETRRVTLRRRNQRRFPLRRRDRRGVLLMVVLSMLALFLLLGTAFLVSSKFYQTTGQEAAKVGRTDNNPADLMERAMLQVLRDTGNPNSAIRYHSLLRDVYGTDGFIGQVYPDTGTAFDSRYAGAPNVNSFGPTEGQFMEIYVADLVAGTNQIPDSTHVIAIERNSAGIPVDYALTPSQGYFNGSLLTLLDGPAAGQTVRIMDYRLWGVSPTNDLVTGQPAPVYRLRVMAFPRANGERFEPAQMAAALAGSNFMVNGRPHNGTGAGYNRLATAGTPRLDAVEITPLTNASVQIVGTPVALTPNSQFVARDNVAHYLAPPASGLDPFLNGGAPPAFQRLNIFDAPSNRYLAELYPSIEGPGGSDESYDAVDFQNMFLAHMPLVPLAEGGQLVNPAGTPVRAELTHFAPNGNPDGLRLDLENTIIPSFHRPALANYWDHQLFNSDWLQSAISDPALRVQAIAAPYGLNGNRNDSGTSDNPSGVSLELLDAIVGIQRKISLRPLREDHPNFSGSNTQSANYGFLQNDFYTWEAVGPWDVDNDNDGVNDSIWVDLGDPVQETEDGRLFKPLYAFLVVDLDNRLNVNLHGSPDHLVGTQFDPVLPVTGKGNLASNQTSNIMPVGMGWGPGDISLRSILSPLNGLGTFTPGDPFSDDYASLLFGRPANSNLSDAIWGRNGSTAVGTAGPRHAGREFNSTDATTITNTREPSTPFEFVGYPFADPERAKRVNGTLIFSTFGTAPDLRGKYATGVDYTGQPIYESVYDYSNGANGVAPVYDDSPYETYTGIDGRRGPPSFYNANSNDDALFSTSDLERILRAYDGEAGTAPSRLYEVVNAFDPNKYVQTFSSTPANPSPEELALAQSQTAINRGEVTSESYEVPVPADVVPGYITEFGPDGGPGRAGVDDDNADSDNDTVAEDDVVPYPTRLPNGNIGGEIGWHRTANASSPAQGLYMAAWSDDFASYTGKSVADARLVDVLWYRIQRDRERRGLAIYNWNNPQAVAILNDICEQLLPPEVLAGYKMDLNRPFGDGADTPDITGAVDLVVDNPAEAGEPTNGGGKWIDLNGNGFYDPPADELWAAQLGGNGARLNNIMGIDVARPVFVDNGSGVDGIAGNGLAEPGELLQPQNLLNDSHLARQLYARHLYVLMLLLSDEDYLAPYDPYDPSVRGYLRIKAAQLEAVTAADGSLPYPTTQAAKAEAQRRYTCRQIAQWAVNCVDFRDSDAANTPFEFDMNPWDGWNCVNDGGTLSDPTDDTYYPLDGDAATDESHAQVVDWGAMGTNGERVITNRVARYGNGGNRLREDLATRGIVWGAERPELMISETAAFHDVRVESFETGSDESMDTDPDQRLEPHGSLFVEVYNPWSNDGPKPVELYWPNSGLPPQGDIDSDGDLEPLEGVRLDKLSLAADSNGRRSPVWRLIVVEEHPGYHDETRKDQAGDTRDDDKSFEGDLDEAVSGPPPTPGNNPLFANDSLAPLPDYRRVQEELEEGDRQLACIFPRYFAPMNFDWDDMYYVPSMERTGNMLPSMGIMQYMTQWQQEPGGTVRITPPPNRQGGSSEFTRQQFAKPYPFIEREFYFTSNNSPFAAFTRNPSTGDANEFTDVAQRSYTDFKFNAPGDVAASRVQNFFDSLRVRIPFNYIRLDDQNLASVPFRFVAHDHTQNADAAIAPVLPGRYAVIGDAGTVYDGRAQINGRRRFINTIGRNVVVDPNDPPGSDMRYTRDLAHRDSIDTAASEDEVRRFEMRPSSDPLLHQWLVTGNGGVFAYGSQESYRGSEYMVVNGAAQNATQNPVTGPVVAIPVDDMNISEPVYGYGVRAREMSDKEDQTADLQFYPNAAYGEGAFAAAPTGTTANPAPPAVTDPYEMTPHWDTPFDVGPEFEEAWDTPRSQKTYRVVHLQRLADPAMPWNPPPGYNAVYEDPAQVERSDFSAHDPALPVNPYLTVDSSSVDLTIFNGTSSEGTLTVDPEVTYGSIERMAKTDDPDGSAGRSARYATFQDFFLLVDSVPRRLNASMRSLIDAQMGGETAFAENHFDYFFQHSLGLPNAIARSIFTNVSTSASFDPTVWRANGAPAADGSLTSTYPWLNWANRPYVSETELLQVPAWSGMELLRKAADISDRDPRINTYNAEIARTSTDQPLNPTAVDNAADSTGNVSSSAVDAEMTNRARYEVATASFGIGGNFVQSSPRAARYYYRDTMKHDTQNVREIVALGAPNFHRILDYVHVPSRFAGTDTLLNPVTFNPQGNPSNPADNVTSAADPRLGHLAPFNRVPNYREPGKVNLNTVRGQRLQDSTSTYLWSDVFDGLMHRIRDNDPRQMGLGSALGHLGPAWRDIVLSRRGYADPELGSFAAGLADRVDLVLNNDSPTFFVNPFRSSDAGDLVPIAPMVASGVNASMLRAHVFQPSGYDRWSNSDDNSNLLRGETRQAGLYGEAAFQVGPVGNQVPLFSELATNPFVDAPRNSAMHYMPLTRLDNLTTTRSGVFAVWVTVGYFEVSKADDWDLDQNGVQSKFRNQTGDTTPAAPRARALYNRVYPQGYTLGQELGADTGDIERHRAFYIIDRTRPVAFKPGEDVNVENAILLRRRID